MNSHQTIPATPLAESSASIESKVLDEPQSVEPQEILGKTVSTPNEAQKIKLGNDKDLLLTIATSSENDLSKEEGLALGSKTKEDTESDSSNSTVDLTGPSYACIDFKQGFIKDDWAKGCEPFQKPHKFLFTGRKPEKDQRTETQVTLGNGNWCRLSGMVTEVGELPSMEQWTSKTCYDTKCNKCIPFEELNPCQKEGFRGFQLAQFGTINGQVVVSLAVLNFDFYYREMNLPFKQDRLYKVTHVANESLELVWEVTKIEDVTEKYASGADGAIPLPESFRKWEAKFGGKNDEDLCSTIAAGSKQVKEMELSKESSKTDSKKIQGPVSTMEEDTESNASDSTVDLIGAPNDLEDTANMNTIDFDNGFIFNHWAKNGEENVPHKTFLWKGRKAEVGQITETFVRVNDQPCRLTGVVTKVGPLPSLKEWQMGTSDVCCAHCLDKLCTHKEEHRDKVLKEFGTLNGQTFESYSYLNVKIAIPGEAHPNPVPSSMKQQRIYKVTYVANEDKKMCVWQVSNIQDVTELYFGNDDGNLPLPREFEAFREHWSDKCGYHCGCGHTNMGASSSTLGNETDLDSQMTDVDGRVEDEDILLFRVVSVNDSGADNTADLVLEVKFVAKEKMKQLEESNVTIPSTYTSSLPEIGSSIEDSTLGNMTTIEVKDGWIEDDWAKQAKELDPKCNRLFTGQRAKVGQGTDTTVIMCNGKPFRFTGVVIEVGPLPSMEEWLKERGYQYIVDTDEFKEQHRNHVLNELGTLHGQTVVSLAYLNVNLREYGENRRDPLYLLPFKENRIYKVTHTASEDKMNAWVVSKIEDVNDLYLGDGAGNLQLPQVFKEFRENWYKPCDCGCHGRHEN